MAQIGTRKMTLFVGGTINTTTGVVTGGTEYTVDVSKAEVTSNPADRDFVSFADAASGGARDYALELTIVQDPATTALWNKIWSAAGTDVPVIVKPYGNVAASTTQPWFSQTATITEPEGTLIGGEADSSSTARFTVDVSWSLAGKPYMLTT